MALEVLRKARPSLTPQFGEIAGALMERRGQTVDAITIYDEVAARFPEDDAGRRAAARLGDLRRRASSRAMSATDLTTRAEGGAPRC